MNLRAALATLLFTATLAFPAAGQVPSSLSVKDAANALGARRLESGFAELAIAASRARPEAVEALALLEALIPMAQEGARKPLLMERAVLLELLERWAEASDSWQQAARTPAGSGDASSLASAAQCLFFAQDAAGAAALAQAAIAISADAAVADRSRVILAWAQLAQGNAAAALSSARQVADSGRERYRLAALDLLSVAAEAKDAKAYADLRAGHAGVPMPLWPRYALMALAADTASWSALASLGANESHAAVPQTGATDTSKGAAPAAGQAAAATASAEASGPRYFQIGAYRDPANAELVRARLAEKGFSVTMEAKKQGELSVTVILVPAGNDPGATLMRIKDAGYEAWPVF